MPLDMVVGIGGYGGGRILALFECKDTAYNSMRLGKKRG